MAPAVNTCPECGTAMSSAGGLCPHCSLLLALDQSPDRWTSQSAEPRSVDSGAASASTEDAAADSIAPGRVLSNRFRIRSHLGRGGMGDVWRAFDLKLRVDVALKALKPELVAAAGALESLRAEVRMARQIVSPHVCRVFDLVEVEGHELVSMEYIDGTTLLDVLIERAPLPLGEAREIAAQFLAGLETIHTAGLVHRDVKPENLMLSRAGRVVLMDFGLAKGLGDGMSRTAAGTPAYMAPEQARGANGDARVDVYSCGVVLAEMIAPGGLATGDARREIWEGIRRRPPEITASPWEPVIRRAVSRAPADRYAGAADLARALEDVTVAVGGEGGVSPYPGLAAFTAADAEYFFGRELEVEEIWKRLRRPQLHALIGPSGVGKSSFIGAGVVPAAPEGWRCLVTTPGDRPLTHLARALASELSDDSEALRRLVDVDAAALLEVTDGWRRRHGRVLLVIDQFEELFTQSSPTVQTEFSELLGRLALEADVHVLLALRDDFLFHCSEQPALKPMFSEVMPLRPPAESGLRRALVQPALKSGFRFEDSSLVDEMIAEVSGERGALPLLAFAAARLWQYRDREAGLLTRKAYEHIGGVHGALARHAEQTIAAIGDERIPIIRELFRNLVTGQGTRATRTRQELLSVFDRDDSDPDASGAEATRARAQAEEVLDALIDARLLVSYEVTEGDDETA